MFPGYFLLTSFNRHHLKKAKACFVMKCDQQSAGQVKQRIVCCPSICYQDLQPWEISKHTNTRVHKILHCQLPLSHNLPKQNIWKPPKKHCFLLHCWFHLSLLFLFLLVLNYFRHVPHFPMFLISRLRIISDTPPPFSNVWKQKSCRLSTVYLLKSKQLDNQQKVSNWKTAKTPSHCAFSEIWLFLIYGQYQWL